MEPKICRPELRRQAHNLRLSCHAELVTKGTVETKLKRVTLSSKTSASLTYLAQLFALSLVSGPISHVTLNLFQGLFFVRLGCSLCHLFQDLSFMSP